MCIYESDPCGIVVVDDVPEVLDLMLRLLRRLGYRAMGVTSAVPSQMLIQFVQPAVVILDVHLGCDGIHLLRQLRVNAATASLPIVVCSGDYPLLADHAHDLDGLGCIVVTKPFTIREVDVALRTVLSHPVCSNKP